jgi:hypothetical protein
LCCFFFFFFFTFSSSPITAAQNTNTVSAVTIQRSVAQLLIEKQLKSLLHGTSTHVVWAHKLFTLPPSEP